MNAKTNMQDVVWTVGVVAIIVAITFGLLVNPLLPISLMLGLVIGLRGYLG